MIMNDNVEYSRLNDHLTHSPEVIRCCAGGATHLATVHADIVPLWDPDAKVRVQYPLYTASVRFLYDPLYERPSDLFRLFRQYFPDVRDLCTKAEARYSQNLKPFVGKAIETFQDFSLPTLIPLLTGAKDAIKPPTVEVRVREIQYAEDSVTPEIIQKADRMVTKQVCIPVQVDIQKTVLDPSVLSGITSLLSKSSKGKLGDDDDLAAFAHGLKQLKG